jgi:hypothetical protein
VASTHSDKLEKWFGVEQVEDISNNMLGWYGPPIRIANVPGDVYATGDGDFIGEIKNGSSCLIDYLAYKARKIKAYLNRHKYLGVGFASLQALIDSVETKGGNRILNFQKTFGATSVASAAASSWWSGNVPVAGLTAGNAPGGTVPDSTTQGAFWIDDITGKDYYVGELQIQSTVASTSLLLYDRIFAVNKTMSSSATEAVTGVPTRYNSGAGINGNFCFPEVGVALSNTAHNWTVCQYTDQSGNTAQNFVSVAGINSAQLGRLDLPLNTWYMPLAAGDTGVAALTQMQCDSAALTGTVNFVIGHPIAWIPCHTAGYVTLLNSINSVFCLQQLPASPCLSLINIMKPTTGAATCSGTIQLIFD